MLENNFRFLARDTRYMRKRTFMGLRHGTLTLSAFVNNVIGRRGVPAGGVDYRYQYAAPNAYSYIQPRTVVFNASETF